MLDQSDDSAFTDIENRLRLAGETPELTRLAAPKEVSVMLYATAMRLKKGLQSSPPPSEPGRFTRAHREGSLTPEETVPQLFELADKVAHALTLTQVSDIIAGERPLMEAAQANANDLAKREHRDDAAAHPAAGLRLIKQALFLRPDAPWPGQKLLG